MSKHILKPRYSIIAKKRHPEGSHMDDYYYLNGNVVFCEDCAKIFGLEYPTKQIQLDFYDKKVPGGVFVSRYNSYRDYKVKIKSLLFFYITHIKYAPDALHKIIKSTMGGSCWIKVSNVD